MAQSVRRNRQLLTAIAVFGAAWVGVLVWFAWWLGHPNDASPYGDGESGPQPIGVPYVYDTGVATFHGTDSGYEDHGKYVSTSTIRDVSVRIDSIHPNIVSDTSNATVTLELCHLRDTHQGIGSQRGIDVSKYCASTQPVRHQTVHLGADGTELLAVITLHRAGTLHIAGFSVAYHDGVRRQTQTSGAEFSFMGRRGRSGG